MEAAIDARSEVREAALVLGPPRTSLNIASERAGADMVNFAEAREGGTVFQDRSFDRNRNSIYQLTNACTSTR